MRLGNEKKKGGKAVRRLLYRCTTVVSKQNIQPQVAIIIDAVRTDVSVVDSLCTHSSTTVLAPVNEVDVKNPARPELCSA